LCVLEVLEAEPQSWLEGEAVFRKLIARGTAISMTTVYRTLKHLEDRGVLLREWHAGTSGGKAVYKLSSDDPGSHAGLIVCRQCGTAVPMDDPALQERLRQLALRHGLPPAKQPMTIHITCARCARTPAGESPRERETSPAPRRSASLRYAERREAAGSAYGRERT